MSNKLQEQGGVYYMFVGRDGRELYKLPIVSQSLEALNFVVRDDMIAVILDCDPDIYGNTVSTRYVIDKDGLALHVIKVHTTKDGWYIPEDKSEWYTIWQPKKEDKL